MIHHRPLTIATSSAVTAAALAGFAVTGAAPAGAAPADVSAAIAYAPDTGSIGWAVDVDSHAEAEGNAMSQCAENGGDCQVVASVVNGCVAFAVGADDTWAGAHGPDKATAEANAVSDLTDARVEASRCTF